jgi:hypothetical protein
MTERTFGTPSLYVEHVPDVGPTSEHPRPDSVERGAGTIEVGVEVDGARIVLARKKAGGVFDDIERAKQSTQGDTQTQTG